MARTYRSPLKTHRHYRRECKEARTITRRKVRAENKKYLRNGDYESESRHRGTQGRMTH